MLFSSAEMFKKPLWQTVWTELGAVCSGSTLFASILNLSVFAADDASRRRQQTTFSDAFFGTLRVKSLTHSEVIEITLCILSNFHFYCFQKLSMSNGLDPDLGHDLDSNCLQRLSADATKRKEEYLF